MDDPWMPTTHQQHAKKEREERNFSCHFNINTIRPHEKISLFPVSQALAEGVGRSVGVSFSLAQFLHV